MGDDPTRVASNVYKLVSENERVRILEAVVNPGDKTVMHSHPDLVAVALSGGKFRFASPDGQSVEAELPDGAVAFFEATEHTTENIGSGQARIILVELK